MGFEAVQPHNMIDSGPFTERSSRVVLGRQAQAVNANTQWLETLMDYIFSL